MSLLALGNGERHFFSDALYLSQLFDEIIGKKGVTVRLAPLNRGSLTDKFWDCVVIRRL